MNLASQKNLRFFAKALQCWRGVKKKSAGLQGPVLCLRIALTWAAKPKVSQSLNPLNFSEEPRRRFGRPTLKQSVDIRVARRKSFVALQAAIEVLDAHAFSSLANSRSNRLLMFCESRRNIQAMLGL